MKGFPVRSYFHILLACLAPAIPVLAADPPQQPPTALQADTGADFNGFHFGRSAPWTSAGNGLTNDHFAPNEFILSKYTVPYLWERWVFTADGEVWSTPTIEKNKAYVADNGGSVWQLDASTGKPIWKTKLPDVSGIAGSYSRNSPAIGAKAVFVGDQASGTLFALSKIDGSLLWKTTLSTVDGAFLTSSAIASNGRVYVGVASDQEAIGAGKPNYVPTARGSVAALDENDGRILWQTYTIPEGYTGGAVWSSTIALDRERGLAYATVGNNYTVPPEVEACQKTATNPAQLDACMSPDNHIDSVLALDMNTGALRWSQRFTHADSWTDSCILQDALTPCPSPVGLDTDFGAGANLFTINVNGTRTDVVGAGQKSGAYFTMKRDTGEIVWGTQVGPDGVLGGILWGTATDGQRIYMGNSNSKYVKTTLLPSGKETDGGFWSALDAQTGKILWQTPTFSPAPLVSFLPSPPDALAMAAGSVSIANGVMYGEDAAGNFVALDENTGELLWTFNSGGASVSAPAIVDSVLYWASGYSLYGPTNNKVYAFWVGVQ